MLSFTIEGIQRNEWATWESCSLPHIPREARWQLHQKKAWTLGQEIILQAFWSDVWKVLRLHPSSENKTMITWQSLPLSAAGACAMSTPHMLAMFWMTTTAWSLLCFQTTHRSLRSVKTTIRDPCLSLCVPLFRKPTSHLILHCPLSVLTVQNTSICGLRVETVSK